MKRFILHRRKQNIQGLAVWLLILGVLLCACSCSGGKSVTPVLRFCFLDVGQGDCTLLRTAEGDVLIDAGTEASQDQLCARLRAMGVTHLALAIFTHLDEDHIGGADGILREFSVDRVWYNGAKAHSDSTDAFYHALEASGASLQAVRAGEIFDIGGVRLTVLAPFSNLVEEGNEGSLVVKVNCGQISALFTGDIGKAAEETLLSAYGKAQLSCQLYKAGHHGSYTSGTEEFLAAVAPQYAVISCGRGNAYGHPHGEVLERLEEIGATVYRTDLLGDIFFVTDGEELQYEDR